MALQLGETAPDFEADTTQGRIRFHEWLGDSWGVLFSHPKDFTPVCTTELGYMARIKPEFDKRGVKIIGLSVDPVDRHAKWAQDIKDTQGVAPHCPMIGDPADATHRQAPGGDAGELEARRRRDHRRLRLRRGGKEDLSRGVEGAAALYPHRAAAARLTGPACFSL